MRAEHAPFPRGWPGIALNGLGFDALRGDRGTYGLYDFDALPGLPEASDEFVWLAEAADAPDWAIRADDADCIPAALARLRSGDLALPDSFVGFFASAALQDKIRSTTGCFLDLSPAAARIEQGHLIRFLSDHQGCWFWYLFLAPGGEHAVVASPGFYGAPEEDWGGPEPDPREIVFCAQSFSVFLRRFWLENEIAFARCLERRMQPLPPAAEAYVAAYRECAERLSAGDPPMSDRS